MHDAPPSEDLQRFVALIAHNEMKPALIEFVRAHRKLLASVPLVATGTTGELIEQETGIILAHSVKSGPLGGDQAIGALIAASSVRAVLFFRDPLSPHPHHADIEALGRLCDVYDVPFATNPSTGLGVLWLVSHDLDEGAAHDDSLRHERAALQQGLGPSSAVVERYKQRQAKVVGEGRAPAPLRRL